MPITHLDKPAIRAATLLDITCDSDGEIGFDRDLPLYLHDIDLSQEEYFLAFFLTGAYQEVLGMKHNLFTHPTQAVVKFDKDGKYYIDEILEAQNLIDVLDDLDYDTSLLDKALKYKIEESNLLNETEKRDILGKLYLYLSENSYLITPPMNNLNF